LKVITIGSWCVVTAGFWRSYTMGSTSAVGKGKGSGGAYGSRAQITARRGREDGDKGLMDCSLTGGLCKVSVAWNFDKMSLPKRGVGQLGRTRKV
jgi:hypothetical protein